jgi:hypothetical protein
LFLPAPDNRSYRTFERFVFPAEGEPPGELGEEEQVVTRNGGAAYAYPVTQKEPSAKVAADQLKI